MLSVFIKNRELHNIWYCIKANYIFEKRFSRLIYRAYRSTICMIANSDKFDQLRFNLT